MQAVVRCKLLYRKRTPASLLCAEPAQFNLSLRGAVALTHDAVSALLRLPVLSGLDITGCGRISSMDKMRLVRRCCGR